MRNKAIPVLAAILLLGSAAAWYWWGRIAPTPAAAATGYCPGDRRDRSRRSATRCRGSGRGLPRSRNWPAATPPSTRP